MTRWPWPEAQVKWFLARANRALSDHPRRTTLVGRYLVHLALHDLGDGPVRDLGSWAKRYSIATLRTEIEAFDDPYTRGLAEAEAGMKKRRGDIIRVRTKPSWWDVRTH